MDTSVNNKRIAKNTIYLYIRMLITMAVSLYTSRVVLDILGVNDFGIYNIIGGIIVLISMVNNSMSAATQRFITFELGKQDTRKVSDTFSMSMTAHLLICLVVLILGETFGLYYIENYLNVPYERHNAALWVYHISLVTIIVNIIRIPYNASVIAYEKMSFFAWISIIETLLRLFIVILLLFCDLDKLILYSFLILSVTIIVSISYKFYCQRNFKTCNYYWVMDKSYFKKLMGFFGWNFVGGMATTGTHQIGNLILNCFCGTIANAAYGVANQVNSAIASFSSNFETAYTPQIVKLYSQKENIELFRLMNRSALLSYYLLFIIAMPIYLYIDLILKIWLVEVPPYTGLFCQWLIIYNLIDSLQAPLWKVITATGNIRNYEIWLCVILFLNIPLSYYCLNHGMPPYSVVVISSLLNLSTAIIRTIHVKIQINFPVKQYINAVFYRSFSVSIIYIILWILFDSYITITSLFSFFLFFLSSAVLLLLLIYCVGIDKTEKVLIKQILINKTIHIFQ